MNKCIFKGRLTRDPVTREVSENSTILSFMIAVDRRRNSNNEVVADFISCVAWNSTAEFIAGNFVKGQCILIEGEARSHVFETENGNRTIMEILVQNVEFAGQKPQAAESDLDK